jgi:hypothetical protein
MLGTCGGGGGGMGGQYPGPGVYINIEIVLKLTKSCAHAV